MRALWNAWLTASPSVRTPRLPRRRRSPATSRAGPLTTACAPLSAASARPSPRARAFVFRISASTLSTGRNTAAILPPAGSAPISAPRRAAKRIPASTSRQPAAQAAPTSPAPWPSTASGTIPTARHNSVSAAASAKSAGCVHSVRSSSLARPSRPNSTPSSDLPSRSSRNTASQRSSTARATGSRS